MLVDPIVFVGEIIDDFLVEVVYEDCPPIVTVAFFGEFASLFTLCSIIIFFSLELFLVGLLLPSPLFSGFTPLIEDLLYWSATLTLLVCSIWSSLTISKSRLGKTTLLVVKVRIHDQGLCEQPS